MNQIKVEIFFGNGEKKDYPVLNLRQIGSTLEKTNIQTNCLLGYF